MAGTAHDDAFHEIQLNGKQLVFLFMAATVVSVVIFLCGVLVGRGVRAQRGVQAAEAAMSEEPTPATSALTPDTTPAAVPTLSDARPPETPSETTYFPRLEGQTPPNEELRPARVPAASPQLPVDTGRAPAPATTTTASAASTAATATSVASPPLPAAGPAATSGWVVQLAALNDRGEAEAIARRLVSKGYEAFVVSPPSGNPSVFRVRVGTFPTRREADTIGAKLKKEEQFEPWVTR